MKEQELEPGGRDTEPGGGRCHRAECRVAFLELASWTREGEELNGRDSSPLGGEREPALARAAAVARCRRSRAGVQVPTGGFGLVASGWMAGRDLGKRWWAVLPPSLGGAGWWVAIPGLCGGRCALWPGHNRCYLTMRSKPEINSSRHRGTAWLAGEQGTSPGWLGECSFLRWLGGQGF